MAEETSSGGNGGLYFIVGGLVVAVAIGAFAYQGGYLGDFSKTTVQQTTTAPAPDGTSTTTTTTKTTP
jgi:hypothetical protein